MNKEIVSAHNVSVTLAGEHIIENVSFTLHEKEVLVILGPNGAGKTTLLRALLGLIPYTGTIIWHTKKISYLPPQELLTRKYLPPLNIADFFSLKNVDINKTQKMLHEVGLDNTVLKKQFTELSTGMFQRMMIAWALISEPDALLFDEPTAGIDIGGEETIYSLLHKFWEERNLSIILITHDLQVVWEHATHVLCLNKKLVCSGAPELVLSQETLEKLYGAGVKGYEHRHRPKSS